jgi:mono/diheme cytochrome c family protein
VHHRVLLLWGAGLSLACLLLLMGTSQSTGQADDPLSDPVALGAWLYEGNCVRCHGAYESARLATVSSDAELIADIRGGPGGCQVTWDRRGGGPLGSREIKALAAYMLAWEDTGGEPELPLLPPQPTPTPSSLPQQEDAAAAATPAPEKRMSEEVREAVEGSPLALGAYLYTENCYRCHQSYGRARMGKGLADALVEKTIVNGKTATSMKPFSRRKGGDLTLREIRAIVGYIAAWERLGEEPALPAVLFTPPTPDPAKLLPILPHKALPVAGDPTRGANLYAIHCAPCHGASGQGAIGPALARLWQGLHPDLTVRSTIQRGVPGGAMPAWSQTYRGPLTDQEIDDLVMLILSWAGK